MSPAERALNRDVLRVAATARASRDLTGVPRVAGDPRIPVLSLHDIGDPVNFGGISSNRTLKPGETFTAKVGLDKWFAFLEPDTYRVTGLYELELCDPNDRGGYGRAIWSDLAAGDCLVRVVPKAE